MLVVITCIFLVCGCSYGPVNTPDLRDNPSVRRIDPNNGPFVVEQSRVPDSNSGEARKVARIKWKPTRISPSLKDVRTFSAGYNSRQFRQTGQVAIPVRMPGGRIYSALLDTGCSYQVYVNDAVVRDCSLAVYPGGKHSGTGSLMGLCEIPTIEFANLTVKNPSCWYDQRQWQFRIFGMPIYRHRTILIGLGLMRGFSYILFDNVKQQVVFNPEDAFEPDDPSQWINLPFVIENRDKSRMMIDISLAGNPVHVEFDTGSFKSLILQNATWQRLKEGLDVRDGADGKLRTNQYGDLPCRRYILPELQIGQTTLRNVRTDILPDDSPFARNVEGIIGLACFEKTMVVMDFKKNLLWLRKF
ncbi:retropepsin-like aspartic protease [Planctomycetota bacterium]